MQQRHQEQEFGGIRFPGILYGGDYNPEQWMEQGGSEGNPIWREDLRLMRKAGVNLVTLGVFSWAALQPGEDTFTLPGYHRLGWLSSS